MSKKLFDNWDECFRILVLMSRDFNRNKQHKIGLAINVCHSYRHDYEKIHRLHKSFRNLLWEIPEAVELGFMQYMEREILKTKEILEYHDNNCSSPIDCEICQDMITTLDNMNEAIYYEEGKRPRIYARQ